MKKYFLGLLFCCIVNFMSAQDFGVSGYVGEYFPMGGVQKTSPLTSVNLELTWWNPDKGFPILGLIGLGYHYEIPGKVETLEFTNSTGIHHGDVIRHSYGYLTRYAWEITQPIQHLSIFGGFGTTPYFTKLEFKPDSPLQPGDNVADSNGNSWDYYDNSNSTNQYRRLSLILNVFAGASYETPYVNFFGQLSFSYSGEGEIPFVKAVGLNVGVFCPISRR